MKTKSVLGGCIMALLAVASGAAYAQMKTTEIAAAENAGRVVDAEGNLRVPADYRTAYQFLGSWAVAADQSQGSKEIHASNDYQCLPGQAHWGTNRGQLELASAAIQRASYTEGAHVSTKSGSKC